MKLTIIVPVFNVRDYVETCLQSLLSQNVPVGDYEIIVINDGSSDDSWDIVRRETISCENVVLLEQENQGLSATRNRGVRSARGDYVWFVDSDDWIDENCLKNIFDELNGCDVLALCHMYEEGDWSGLKKYSVKKGTCSKKDYLTQDFPFPAQFYICRREFLIKEHVEFVVGIKHEDCLFTPIAIAKSHVFKILEKPVYHFRKRPNSITTVIDPKRAYDYGFIIDKLFEYRNNELNFSLIVEFDSVIARVVKAHLSLSSNLDKQDKKKMDLFYCERKQILKCLLHSKLNSKLFYYACRILPVSIVKLYGCFDVCVTALRRFV